MHDQTRVIFIFYHFIISPHKPKQSKQTTENKNKNKPIKRKAKKATTKHVFYLLSIISSYHYTNKNKIKETKQNKNKPKKATTKKQKKEPVYMNNICILQLDYDVIT
jgi:hypothetical protein